MSVISLWRDRLRSLLWGVPPPDASRGRELLVLFGRIAYLLGRDVVQGRYSLRAKSLVYTTLLALVPMLALAFFVLKAIGIHRHLEPVLLELVAPLGAKGAELVHQTMTFISELKVGVLGVVGVVFLVYTAISLLVQLEVAFNDLWRVERARSLTRRISDYLAALLVGPVLVVSALSLAASAFSAAALEELAVSGAWGSMLAAGGKSASMILLIAAFTLMYVFIPNTRVRWIPALCGGVLAGLAWELAGSAFAGLMVTSATYAAFYSGFAIVVLFLIWMYVGWLIVLLGAQIAYIVQFPEQAAYLDGADLRRTREQSVYALLCTLADRYRQGAAAPTRVELARDAGVEESRFAALLQPLIERQWIVRSDDDLPRYALACAPERITVAELRRAAGALDAPRSSADLAAPAGPWLARIDQLVEQGLGAATLADVLVSPATTAP